MTEGKRTKQFYEQRASDEMARHFLSADYDTRQKLALAGRMLAREEHESGLAGQITARAERPGKEAAVLAVFMERAAKMQLRARAIGPIKPIRPELAREAHQYRLKPKAIEATFNYFARQIRRDQGDEVIK